MKPAIFLTGLLVGLIVFVGYQAEAFSGPTKTAVAFTIACGGGTVDGGVAGSVEITSPKVGALSYCVDNPSTTVVYLGDRDVRGDGTSGYPICTTTTTCSDSALTVDVRRLYCAAASAVTVNVIALTNGDI